MMELFVLLLLPIGFMFMLFLMLDLILKASEMILDW